VNARRKIETVMADIFGQYLAGSGFDVLAGRGDGTVNLPFFALVAEEVLENPRGSGLYLSVVKFVVVTDSNTQITAAQDQRIGECMDVVRQLSNTLCNGNTCITDAALKIIVDGIAQMSQFNADDDQAFGDEVEMRIGFREVDSVQAAAPAPNAPIIIPPWWTPTGFNQPAT
jgi:hypothetical protein